MKLITKTSRKISLAIIGMVLLVNMLSGLSILFSGTAEAAPPAGAHTVYGDSSTLCAPTLEYLSPGAEEAQDFFNNVYGVNGPAGAAQQMMDAFGQYRGNQVAQDTYGALYYNIGGGSTSNVTAKKQNVAVIDFKGANGAGNSDSICKESMVLFKAASDKQSSTFFGMWNCAPNNNYGLCQPGRGDLYKLISATIKYSGSTPTLSFSLPNNVNATGSAAPKLGDPHSLLNDCDYFSISPKCSKGGGGGGSGGGGSTQTLASCFVQQNTSGGAQDCIGNKTAAFTDIGHIYFDGEMYDAGKWSGPSIHYTLDSSSKDKDLAALSPYFNVDVDNDSGQMDLNVDHDGKSQSQLEDVRDAILRDGKHRYIAAQTITYHTNAWSLSVDTDTSSLNNVATYYPSKDIIELNFTDGAGTNESHYYGKYTRLDATHYTLANGGYAGCGTKDVPQFIMDTDPHTLTAKENGITTATWQLWDNESPCKNVNIRPVNVFIADQSATPPAETNTSNKSGNADQDKPTCESNGDVLAWIMCGIVEDLADAVNGINENIVQPLLQTHILDTTTSGGNTMFKVWSGFRAYGDAFLVIALLVIVFGQSIGGGLIDAYTAKKVLPRLLAAAVLINLSYYIVSGLVDITNVLGAGLDTLISGPFGQAGAYKIQLGFGASAIGLTGIALGSILAVAGAGALLEFAFAFVLLPGLFIFIAIMVTVLLRRAIIILLLMISPVAFALYCLPNTEQYFKRWWSELFKALLVYPIIEAMFAISKVLSVTINWGNGGGGSSVLIKPIADLMSIAALFVPLFLIPFAFRIAGGFLGKAHDLMQSAGKKGHQAALGNPNDPYSWRNRARYKLGDQYTKKRERAVARGRQSDSGLLSRGLSRALNYGNLQAKRSVYNKNRSEMLQGQIATGDDSNIRDLFIKEHEGKWYRRMDMQRNEDGSYSVKAGAQAVYENSAVGAAAHRKALSLYKGDKSAVQDAMYYEWKKTSFNPEQMGNLETQMGDILGEHGFTDQEGKEMMKAVGFRHQGQSLASKYSTYKGTDASGAAQWSVDHIGLAKEISHNIGTFQMQQQDQDTYNELANGYEAMGGAMESDAVDANGIFTEGAYKGKAYTDVADAYDRIGRIADAIDPDQRVPGGGQQVAAPEHDGDQPQMSGYGGVSSAPVEVQAAARRLVGVAGRNARNTRNGGGGPPTAPPSGGPTGGGSGGGGGPTLIVPPRGYTGSQG